MKKYMLLLLLLLSAKGSSLENFAMIKYGPSRFTDSVMEEIYHGWHLSYGAEAGVKVNSYLSFSLNYIHSHATGHSFIINRPLIVVDELTHSTSFTVDSLGLLAKVYPFHFHRIKPYVGIGPTLFFPSFSDNSNFVVRHPRRAGIGGTLEAGIHIGKGSFFIEPFIEYDFVRINFLNFASSENFIARLDDVMIGLGFGASF